MNSKVINNTRSNLSSLFGGFVEVVTKKVIRRQSQHTK